MQYTAAKAQLMMRSSNNICVNKLPARHEKKSYTLLGRNVGYYAPALLGWQVTRGRQYPTFLPHWITYYSTD